MTDRPMGVPASGNEDQVAYWNGEEADHWVSRSADYDTMLRAFSDEVIRVARISDGENIIDIGCGCGALAIVASTRSPKSSVIGIDLSTRMLNVARARVASRGIANMDFLQSDAQTHSFEPASADLIISRFGVMFFSDPIASFANIASALRPQGRLVFACWQTPIANEWLLVPGLAVARYFGPPPVPQAGAPGPFAFADRDYVIALLSAAGFVNISLAAVHHPMPLPGTTAADAVDFYVNTGMGRTLLAAADGTVVDEALAAMAAALAPFLTNEGVVLSGNAWIVTAELP